MKAKTIKRHVIILDDYEARLIYYVLRHLEKQDYREIDAIGVNRDKLHELKECFYDLFSYSPGQENRFSTGATQGNRFSKGVPGNGEAEE